MFLIDKKGNDYMFYDISLKDKDYLLSLYESDPKVIVRRKDNGWNDDILIAFRGFDYVYDFMLILCDFYGNGWGQNWKCCLFDEEGVAVICKLQKRFSEDEIIHGYIEAPEWEMEE